VEWQEGEKVFELYLVSESAGHGGGGGGGGVEGGGPCDTEGVEFSKVLQKKKTYLI
jgi:hypothetical protein